MTDEREDFDEPQMADLMRRFGEAARDRGARPLFEPPSALDLVERDLVPPASGRRFPRSAMLAAAASLLLAFGLGWWALAGRGGVPGISAPYLSDSAGVTRGKDALDFRSGDRIWLHFVSDRAGVAFVALLDADDVLAAITDGIPLRLGPNAIGPFALDDRTGTESILLLTSERERTSEDVGRILNRARQISPTGDDHQARLGLIVEAIRAQDDGVVVTTVTYRHLP